ncbi:fasciclin domain-containing protein [Xylanibacter brevis]|uniref:fasciclin domain-containing protein n=1 Tax=Xylanibacter brevis TaxID=83231 RepID=UPI000AA1CA1A|nr:fasciclin domain-containing protein [Xylanibacter brevis]
MKTMISAYVKRKLAKGVLFGTLAVVVALLASCNSDDLSGDSYYTFKGETVATYIENRPDSFAIFTKIVEDAGEYSLLSTYGHYTAFVPTDVAFDTYFKAHHTSLDALTKEEKQQIVYNHIIRSTAIDYLTKDFTEGALGTSNMNNRYVIISYATTGEGRHQIWVNKQSQITVPDVELHNGVVHVIDHVLEPSDETLGSILDQMPAYSIFAEALRLTHLNDSITETYDMTYKSPYTTEFVNVLGYTMKPLQQRRLGYTLFAEPNSVMEAAGIHNIADLERYAQTYYGREDEADPTSRHNALNKFVSYHMLNRQMSTNSFIYNGVCTSSYYMGKRYEYYETMLENRLIEFKAGNHLNEQRDGRYVGIDESRSNIDGMNGFIHSLTDMLVYDETVMQHDVLNKRIRFDAYSIPPQLTNNNIRWKLTNLDGFGGYTMSPDYCGDYLKFNDASKFIMWASDYWTNYQADEISVRGWYDVTVRMLPVPPGTYEIRLGYSARSWGGIAQLFVDGDIIGIPVSFNYTGEQPQIGWISDDQTTDNGAENDKMMRNRGYMKGPNSVYAINGQKTLRQNVGSLRFIVGTFTFQDYGPHYFRVKNIESELGEFHFDYLEYVPTSLIDTEDKD